MMPNTAGDHLVHVRHLALRDVDIAQTCSSSVFHKQTEPTNEGPAPPWPPPVGVLRPHLPPVACEPIALHLDELLPICGNEPKPRRGHGFAECKRKFRTYISTVKSLERRDVWGVFFGPRKRLC